jgi:ABC-type bacteriocin/lantibiotic exporter with double-glycine peptidase domain
MLHTLSRSLRENKGPALVTVLLSALEVVFEIVIPLYMSNLIDFGIEGGSMAAVWKFGAFLLLLAAFQLATGALRASRRARPLVSVQTCAKICTTTCRPSHFPTSTSFPPRPSSRA